MKEHRSAFQICMTHGVLMIWSSKSEQGARQKWTRHKKTLPQFCLNGFLRREYFKSNLETSLRRNNDFNISYVSFFVTLICLLLTFDSTLRAYIFGLNHLYPQKLHIFGKPRVWYGAILNGSYQFKIIWKNEKRALYFPKFSMFLAKSSCRTIVKTLNLHVWALLL